MTRAQHGRAASGRGTTLGRGRCPHAIYKSIGWQKGDGGFTARGYIIKQDDTGSDLTAFLVSIDTIEAETGVRLLRRPGRRG